MNQQTCNSAWLDGFLKNDLNESEEQVLTLHLDECSDCREELESRAAEQSAWREASNLLGGAKVADLSAINALNCGEIHENHLNARSPQIELVLQQLAPTDDPESLGRIGGYEVTGVVGAGGMGVVLKAHDRSLDRVVAIKVMSPHLASSGSARKRFAREAKAAAAVLHPNVIAIHSVASEDASPYLVMPYVRGASLQKRIDSHGPLPLKDTLRIGSQIAAGLAAAHEQGLVHRDIKPANILLEEGVERVTITDFGLARAVDDASMTCSGVIAGTPQYMSPEQTRGEPIDARSDLFSLGSVLYTMCAGRPPFRAETTYGVLHRIANDKPTPICEVNSDVPVWLGHIIDRLMAKRADDRFESATQVSELLEGCLAHVQQPAAMPLPEAATVLAPRKIRRPPFGKFIAVAAGAFALFFAGILIVLELNKGTLTIDCDADDVPIRIMQGDNVVEKMTVSKSPQDVRIAAGNYVVEVDGDFHGVTIKDGKVSLTRRGAATVEISKNAKLVLAGNFRPGNIDGLRFGERHERIDPIDRGYGNYEVAEPGEMKEIFASFPTLGNGIEEVGLIVSVEPPHKPTEPSNMQTYLVRASGVRRIKSYAACEASVEGKEFFKPDNTPYTVGYFQLQLDGEEKENVTVDMIAGSAHVNISYVVGVPNEQVRKILKIDAPSKHSESWLSVNLQTRPQSAWASHLMKLDGWEYDRTRGVPNMIQQELTLKSGETRTVSIEPSDVRDASPATSSMPHFSTPEALMKHAAECQSKGDAPGFMACWTDQPFKDLVPSYLLTSLMQLQYHENAPSGKKPRHPKELLELKQILAEEFGDKEAGRSLLALAMAHKEIADRSDDKFAEAAEATVNSPLVQLLATGSTNFINPRSFITRLAALHEKYQEPDVKKEPKVFAYTVEQDGDKAVATETTDKNKFGLIKTEAGWRINDLWFGLKPQDAAVPDTTSQSLQGVWEFISVESDGVVREYKTLKTQPEMARLTITGDMWIVKAGDGSNGSDLGSGGHRVKINGNKLTFYGTTTSMPGLGSSKEISTIGYGLFRIDGDSLVYIVTPAVAGGDFTGQSELPIKFPESFTTKGTQNNVFRLRRVGENEAAARDPLQSNKVPMVLNPFEARTLDEVTSAYNEQTRQLRTELFNPPIPNLTTDQMRVAMLDAAEQYRKQGRVEIASALNTSAETNRLADRLTFMGMSGTMSEGFRQITPTFHFEVASNARFSIVLRKAELRYSLNGWSSKACGEIHPPFTGKWELVSVEERDETLKEDAFNEWRQTHASWTALTIDESSLKMAGDNTTKFDFEIDYESGPLAQYMIRRDGDTKYSGVLMGNGFIDDTTVVFAVDLDGGSTPKTFHTNDGKTTNLTYRRNGEADIQANALLKTDVPSGSVEPIAAQSTEVALKIFQGHPIATDRTKNAFETATASAHKDGKPLNTLYLLAALIRNVSLPTIAEIAEQKKVAMKDLIERCELAAQVADATSVEQWQTLAATADDTAKQWKHDYLGTEHLLMALIAEGTLTKRFLSEQGIEAAAIRDMAVKIYFSPGRDAPAIRPTK